MRRLALLGALTTLPPAFAAEVGEPSWPPGPDAVLPAGEYILLKDTALEYDVITLENGTIITTAGHDLDLHVRQSLKVNGTAVIRSFDPKDRPEPPPQAKTGADGITYVRGPNTEGTGRPATNGSNGGAGAIGISGKPGLPGKDGGLITLRFNDGATASGKLVVRNIGGTGGDGGRGGNGGHGGDGQQGGRGDDGPSDCAHGPGFGGTAGDGGPGALGGPGGEGGRGGTIVVQGGSQVKGWLDTLELSVSGGERGKPGSGGKGGNPGEPGYGGRGSHRCQGKEADRMGKQGQPGKDETAGLPGASKGPDGKIKRL